MTSVAWRSSRNSSTPGRFSTAAVLAVLVPQALPSAHAAGKTTLKPVTYYFHGSTAAGEVDIANGFPEAYMTMDAV